ncbi:hypothetical protein [Stygiolobus caldivivus]|nr:hypothetical protein [Stygiolobus caldivivus]
MNSEIVYPDDVMYVDYETFLQLLSITKLTGIFNTSYTEITLPLENGIELLQREISTLDIAQIVLVLPRNIKVEEVIKKINSLKPTVPVYAIVQNSQLDYFVVIYQEKPKVNT